MWLFIGATTDIRLLAKILKVASSIEGQDATEQVTQTEFGEPGAGNKRQTWLSGQSEGQTQAAENHAAIR